MNKEKLLQSRWFIITTALFCCALWGSATPFIKIGYTLTNANKSVPSTILFAGCRFFLSGILTILIYSIARKKFLLPKRQSITSIVKLSFFQTILQYTFFYIGLANTSGVKGTVESASNAFLSLFVASLIFKQEKLTPKKILACILGFGGLIIMNLHGLDFKMNFFGDCFVVFSSLSMAFSSVLVKDYSKRDDPVILSGYQFIIGGATLILIGAVSGGAFTINSIECVGVLIYLAMLSAIAYSLWSILLKYNHVSRITVFSFSTPILGVILSKLMLSEASNVSPINLVITLIMVCTGILMLNYNKQ